ncbi:MAG: heme ABC transporter permease CcmC [Methylacidiphilales bacterium]|nr:heme ABC transporter permease CcmC [Candidatus Methylacidiphilales bacterium]
MPYLSFLYRFGNPEEYFNFSKHVFKIFGIFGSVTVAYGLYQGLFIAPPDYQQLDAFRLIYVHVPCAWLSLFIYCMMAGAETIYLIWKIKVSHLFAVAASSLGAVTTLLALITGSLWGKPMWGAWWVWGDARLLSELFLLCIYVLYIIVATLFEKSKAQWSIPATICVLGIIQIPIIHYSVEWWATLHQGTTVSVFGESLIDSSMLSPLLISAIGFSCLALSLIHLRLMSLLVGHNHDANWVKRYE